MKPLTRYTLHRYVYGWNERSEMTDDPDGNYYAKDEADARIAELEAERDAARADAERLRGHMRYFVGNDFNRVRKQRDQAHKALERIAASRQEDYVSASQWAWACVQEATAIVGEQE